ncbi:MAG TPA: glucosaminidase domain-containing protein [Bacteroidales bacterium]|nr:glucosaminidase domain-containing protein [Bacteroidales bacterium]
MRTGLLWLGLCLSGLQLAGQSSERMTRSEYFEIYGAIAVSEMHRSGVPASITLAQGALESGDGNSRLARNGNNHFGIKCHNDWNGRKLFQNDDARNECFRKYQSAEESYRDHSEYLRSKQRYAFLFEFDPTDYKAWARGLKKAGYATSPTYADALIRIIEEYNLHTYDTMDGAARAGHRKPRHNDAKGVATTATRPLLERNRVKYIVAKPGDTYESLAQELGKLEWELPRYNDADLLDTIHAGEVVYLQPKRNKAEPGKKVHTVKQGESLYSISQLYAIKLNSLGSMNQFQLNKQPAPGTGLFLRKAVKMAMPNPVSEHKEDLEDGEEEVEIRVVLDPD